MSDETPSASPRAVLYLRVSTREQADTDYNDDGLSILAQREACTRSAEQLGATVVDVYVDRGASARSANRPALQDMLRRLTNQRDIDYVIIHKVDRLARSREDDVAISLTIRKAGATLVSATENIDNTPSGKLVKGIMADVAEFYVSNLAAEAMKGMQQKAKLGGTNGRAPIGYTNTIDRSEGREIRTVVIDPERAAHVVWAFNAYASGDMTVRTLTEALDARGLRCRPTKRTPEQPLKLSHVHKMLTNRYYIGQVRFAGVLYDGRHEPLVSVELFNQVQELLAGKRQWGERPKKRTHYLKGSLFCALCGRMLSISYSRGHGGVYAYFYCLGRHVDRKCGMPYLAMDEVEHWVENFWRTVDAKPARLAKIRTLVDDYIAVATKEHEQERKRHALKLRQLDKQRRKLLEAHYNDAISLDLLREEQARIIKEKAHAEQALESLSTEADELREALDSALSDFSGARAAYLTGDDAVRRDLNMGLFKRLWVTPEGIIGAELKSPYVDLLADDLAERIVAEVAELKVEVTVTARTATTTATRRPRRSARVPSGPSVYRRDRSPLASRIERPSGPIPLETTNPAAWSRPGSNEILLVGLRGFEPPAS